MSRTSAIRDAWRPQTREDHEAIHIELRNILASPHFSNSKRYPALLQYVVEATLEGKSDLLKERTLGVEVFDRPPSYDTNADTVVRYTAGEVRKRLSLYYHELDRKPAIQISLPAGSYIPEFQHTQEEAEGIPPLLGPVTEPSLDSTSHRFDLAPPKPFADTQASLLPPPPVRASRRRWWLLTALLVVALFAGTGWHYRTAIQPRTPLDDFWAPILHNQTSVLVCTGAVIFKEGNFSGVITAGKDIDYPFVSMQIASSIARLSSLVERSGATTQVSTAATTPLTELRAQPVILLGGYNNQWTMRLLDPLPFHFAPEPSASIVSANDPHQQWQRDHSLPYSSADDYALVARFRDIPTDHWVVVLAGIGRNGTEAAAEMATSPHYMQVLRDRIGSDFDTHNVEAVLKVNVIDGKTGAPSILATRAW